jgi:Ca2+-binding EF-hand superfamily protein
MTRFVLTSIALSLLLTPYVLRAEDSVTPAAPQSRPGVDAFFQRFDVNHDGYLALDELPPLAKDRLAAIFAKADANGDNRVDKQEAVDLIKNLPLLGGRGAVSSPSRTGSTDQGSGGALNLPSGRGLGQLGRARLAARGTGRPLMGGQLGAARRPLLSPENLDLLMSRFDTNHDGKIQYSEAPPRIKEIFSQIDTDQDQALSREEAHQALERILGRAGL